MKKVIVLLAIIAAAAACGGASTASSSTYQAGAAPKAASGQTGAGAAGQPSRISGGGATDGSTSTGGGTGVPALQGPPVIRQAQLDITVDSGKFDSKLSEVRTLVEAVGGYIAGTDASVPKGYGYPNQDGTIRTGTISFMVPAAKFDTTIDQLSHIGSVQSEHISGTDVSAQYVDLNARLVNAQAQRDAMLALLGRATNISDIIAIQNQIGQITAQIEQLKGQIKYLDDNTSYSSVSVSLTEAGAPVQTTSDNWGFATALNDAAHNFVTTINYVISGLGALGPLLLLGGVVYVVWRRRRVPAAPKHA